MTTSFNRTRTQLGTLILGKLGVLAGGQTAASADTDLVYEAIDLRLKELHRLGIFWRKVTTVPVTFSLGAGINSASAGAGDILFPLNVTFVNGSLDDPVSLIGPREYADITDKTRSGNPEKVLWKGGSEFLFYPVPGANGTGKLLYEKITDDTSAGAVIDVDVSMLRWVRDLISYDLGDYWGKSETTMERFRKEAETADRNIRKLGSPRIDFTPVSVDDWGSGGTTETDYGWRR